MFNLFKKKIKEKKPQFFPHRLLFIMQGCEHCKLIYGVAEELNVFLPPEKRIRIVDVTHSWNFNMDIEPIINYIELKGTPTLFLGGYNPIVVEGITTREYFKGYLKGYLEKVGDL